MRLYFSIALLCAVPAAFAADVYKWTDAGGVVHYSDTEPAGASDVQLVHLNGTATAGTTQANAEANPAMAEAAKPAQGTLVAAKSENGDKLCAQARSNLELLQSNQPVGLDPGGSGKAEPLDDAARQRQIANAQSLIARYCK